MKMDYTECVEFVRKYASRGELHELMRPASKPYRYTKTTIHLTYFSMPDWLAILSAARWPEGTGSGEEPIRQVLRVMALTESKSTETSSGRSSTVKWMIFPCSPFSAARKGITLGEGAA